MSDDKKKLKYDNGLTPIDFDRCQAERPNGYSFMTLGGSPGMERCRERPIAVVSENEPDEKDGLRGAMSLCDHCLRVFREQVPAGKHTFWTREGM